MANNYDFSGWATRNDIRCSDGRTIRQNAFADDDGITVPLVWNHQHDNPANVLGHALLENRPEGVYAYCSFNDTPNGRDAKEQVKHKDIVSLSIYANQLKQNGGDVLHGAIREVSLVLASANPGALIDSVMVHGELVEEQAIIYSGEALELSHSEEAEDEPEEEEKKEEEQPEEEEVKEEEETLEHSDEEKEKEPMAENEKTVKDVFDELTEEQKNVVYFMIGQALEDAGVKAEGEGENEDMKHNVFDNDNYDNALSHSDMESIFDEARACGSLKRAFSNVMGEDATLSHAVTDRDGNTVAYGIADIDYLFPDAKNLNTPPDFIKRNQDWVARVMGKTHHTPFSRIKSTFANITMDEARARGYVKGNRKVEEVFSLLKRTTTPQTIYKKQKLDRDDIIDITDFDVVSWLKAEMRMMLDEEIARAILIGDGRSVGSDDKISEDHIRPIWTDDALYTINQVVQVGEDATYDQKIDALVDGVILGQETYEGSGNQIMFCDKWFLTRALLKRNQIGERLWKSKAELASEMGVNDIVPVPSFANQTRKVLGKTRNLVAIIVDLADYNVGADKGGEVNMFDDFDIDYNQEKYLIETRCSGALIKPYSAIALEMIVGPNGQTGQTGETGQ